MIKFGAGRPHRRAPGAHVDVGASGSWGTDLGAADGTVLSPRGRGPLAPLLWVSGAPSAKPLHPEETPFIWGCFPPVSFRTAPLTLSEGSSISSPSHRGQSLPRGPSPSHRGWHSEHGGWHSEPDGAPWHVVTHQPPPQQLRGLMAPVGVTGLTSSANSLGHVPGSACGA